MEERPIFKLILTILLFMNSAAAQILSNDDLKFVHLRPGNSMDENSVTCFLQDRQGFMWIGTKGGLYRYDGYEFQPFMMEPWNVNSLSDSYIRCIVEYSKDEFLLIGTNNGGLNIYEKRTGRFSHFLHNADDSTSIGSNAIFDMLEDEEGRIWIATVGGGLNSYDMESNVFKRYYIDGESPDGRSRNYIKCLFLDEEGGLWVGTRNLGLHIFDRRMEKFTRVFKETDDPRNTPLDDIWTVSKDQTGSVWIGTEENQIFRLKKDDDRNYRIEKIGHANGFDRKSALKIYCDRGGTIWAGAWAGGLFKFNHETNRFIGYRKEDNELHGLSGNHVLTIFEDDAGSLWIGTHASGISIIQPEKWKFFPHRYVDFKEGRIQFDQVRVMHFQEKDGTLWLGTTQGLMRINTKTGERFHYSKESESEQRMLHNAVNTICQSRDSDVLWIGTPVGFTRMNTCTDRLVHYRSQLIDKSYPFNINILQIIMDDEGILWMASPPLGLIRFNPITEEFIRYRKESENVSPIRPWSVFSVSDDHQGRIYVGTSEGVEIFDKGRETFTPLLNDSHSNAMLHRNISVIYQKSPDQLWIGTMDYGMIKYDVRTEEFEWFNRKDGLASNSISSIMEDENGMLFIGTDNGISRFDPAKREFVNYGVGDGLHGMEFLENSCCKSEDGMMFFGGMKGFSSFLPGNMVKNVSIPPVNITRFDVMYSDTPFNGNALYTSEVELNYRMNSFSIEFVTLNYINPQKNRCAFKLESYDRDWQQADRNRHVVYRNVDPGDYVFRVIGSNNDGIWNEQGDTLSIHIKPPFWKTSVFKAVVICLILGMIYCIIKRSNALLKRESEIRRRFTHALIKNQEYERKRIASELHDSLGQDLLVIKNQTKLVLKKQGHGGHDQLEQICSVADEAIANIRQISYNLHPYQLDKIGLTESLKSMIDKVNEASSVEFSYEIENIDDALPKDQEINFYRVVQELLNNIIKHSDAGHSRVKISRVKRLITVSVKDDGIGFEYEKVKNQNRGLGLSGVRERIDILKGSVEIESKINRGTRVMIEIPI